MKPNKSIKAKKRKKKMAQVQRAQVSSVFVRNLVWRGSRQLTTTAINPTSSATASIPKVRRRRWPRRLANLGIFGVASYGLVKFNAEYSSSLPKPLELTALYLEGIGRFFVTSYYLIPTIASWLFQLKVVEKYYNLTPKELNDRYDRLNLKTAKRLLALARLQGGIYIKNGQQLAASPVLPPAYAETLKVLMDNAIIHPISKTEATWRENFGNELRDNFASFDETPIATASLAQVYRAVGKDGTPLAIKVQHHDVVRLFNADLYTLEAYHTFVAYSFPDFDFKFFVEEFRRGLEEELNFRGEVKNAIREKELLKNNPFVHIPDVIEELCSDQVITMKFEEGTRIDDLDFIKRNGLDPKMISQTVIELFGQMMFVDGFVHCDPHPGNILVRPAKNARGCQIVLLDHGIYQELTGPVLLNYAQMWRSVIAADLNGMEQAAEGLGIDKRYAKIVSLIFTLSPSPSMMEQADSLTMEEKEEIFRQAMGDGKDSVSRNEHSKIGKQLPRQLILLIKANNLLRFVNEQLGSPVNRFSILARYAVKGINHYRWQNEASVKTLFVNSMELVRLNVLLFIQPMITWCINLIYKPRFNINSLLY